MDEVDEVVAEEGVEARAEAMGQEGGAGAVVAVVALPLTRPMCP